MEPSEQKQVSQLPRGRMQLGSVADWVSGIATSAAVILALTQIAIERANAREERAAASIERTRDQASHVTAWFHGDKPGDDELDLVYIRNTSDMVIYDVMVAMKNASVDSDGTELNGGYLTVVSQIPPGLYSTTIAGDWEGMSFVPSIDLSFTDSEGHDWLRNNRGRLSEQRLDIWERHDDVLMKPWTYADYEPVRT